MTRSYYFLIFTLLFLSCNNNEEFSYPDGILFPKDTHTILQINKKKDFLSAIEDNLFWKSYMPDLPNESLKKVLNPLPDSLTYWLTFTNHRLYIISSRTNSPDSLSGWKSQPNKYFFKKINSDTWYCKKIGNRLFISTDTDLDNFVEEKTIPLPSSIKKLNFTINPKAIANIFIEKSSSKAFFDDIFNRDITKNFRDWVALDLFLDETSIKLNGTSLLPVEDSIKVLSDKRLTAKWKDIAPAYISQISSYTLNNKDQENLPDFAKLIYGINILSTQRGDFIALNSTDADSTLSKFPIVSEENFGEQTIYKLSNNKGEVNNYLKTFAPDFNSSFVIKYDDYLILTEKEEALKSLFTAIQQNIIFSATKSFLSLEKQMVSAADETFVTSLPNNKSFKSLYPKITENFALASLQISSANNLSTLNFISEKSSSPISMNIPKLQFTTLLEDSIVASPKIVINHNTQQKEVLLQNSKNELVLISSDSKILFKIPLDSVINSGIYQVDLFRNGKLQYTFTTQNAIWVIDRNGNKVAPYPKKYNGTLSPLEIYDYNQTHDYRFVTVEDKSKIHLLSGRGQIVKGFSPPKPESSILQTPKHFRIKSKDYLVYPTKNGILRIVHRDGRIRIPVTETFDFSENPIIALNNSFSFTTSQGKIVDINTFGNIAYRQDSLGISHHRTVSNGLEVFLSGTDLKINNKTIKLAEGEYQAPKIHNIKKDLLISIFDSKNHKVYLYNQEGMLISYFPMESHTDIDMGLSEKKTTIMAITPEPNKISLYELN